MRTRVKICGITRVEDAWVCAELGADAIGLVFYPPSPRNISVVMASQIVQHLPPFVTTVGLFMNAESEWVRTVMDAVPLDLLQFHGRESAPFCEQFAIPYIKAIPMGDATEFTQMVRDFDSARGWLLDSHGADQAGGTGQTFDWLKVPQQAKKPVILAGGLTPDNVQSAIQAVRPYAVDCSSGVESAPGIKDHDLIRRFMENADSV